MGLEVLHAHVQYNYITICHGVGLLLIIGGIIHLSSVFFSVTGMCSRGGTAPGSMTCSDTKRIFCLTGSVSLTDSPCEGSLMIAVGLGVCNRSCTSSVSHLMYLSKSPAVGSGVWVSVCLYSTVGSSRGGWVAFGPADTVHMGWDKRFLSHSQTATLPQ